MTMVAGFKIDGTPFLMGDLITSVHDSSGELRRSQVTKKVAILSPNCAVAWTGNAYSAGKVLDELFERFRNVEVTREEIEGYLTSREPDTKFFDVQLVVWVVGTEECLFQWGSSAPLYPSEYEPIVLGTGSDSFEDVKSRLDYIRVPPAGGMEKIGKALMYFSELMTLEIKEPSPTFGFGYEVVAYLDGKFSHIAKILYCDIRAACTGPSDIRATYAKLYGSFVYDCDGEPNLTCLTWIDIYNKTDTDVMLVTPPGKRPWIGHARNRWTESVNEDANEILRKLLGSVVLYCVRVTLTVGETTLRPVHFLYDCLSTDKLDRDNSVIVQASVIDSNIDLRIAFGENFGRFMIARG